MVVQRDYKAEAAKVRSLFFQMNDIDATQYKSIVYHIPVYPW